MANIIPCTGPWYAAERSEDGDMFTLRRVAAWAAAGKAWADGTPSPVCIPMVQKDGYGISASEDIVVYLENETRNMFVYSKEILQDHMMVRLN